MDESLVFESLKIFFKYKVELKSINFRSGDESIREAK